MRQWHIWKFLGCSEKKCTKCSQFSLSAVAMFYKVGTNTELANTEALLLEKQ